MSQESNDPLYKPEEQIQKVVHTIDMNYVPNGKDPVDLSPYILAIPIVSDYEDKMFPYYLSDVIGN